MVKFKRTLHRLLWQFLVDNPMADKKDWPGWKVIPHPQNDCFACQYLLEKKGGRMDCKSTCPLLWPGGGGCCTPRRGGGEIYAQWESNCNPDERRRLAIQIRDLDVRPNVSWE